MSGVCSVDGCSRPVSARGMCHRHYSYWRRRNRALMRPYRRCRVSGVCYVDMVAVERALDGDRSVLAALSAAERVEVARRILAAGRPPTHVAYVLRMSGATLRRFLTVNGLAS